MRELSASPTWENPPSSTPSHGLQGRGGETYPFCTIDPLNVGIVPVPDSRMDRIVTMVKPNSIVPTTMEFVDIAGIVEGASKGEGLGNQFLSHIRQTDAILHVVRCFTDPEVIHVAGGVNPIHDIDIINTELLLADLDTVEKRLNKAEKAAKGHTATAAQKSELATIQKLLEVLQRLQARPHRRPRRLRKARRPRPLPHHHEAAALRRQRRRRRHRVGQ